IAVGSNIDPLQNIRKALRLMTRQEKVLASSRFYRTPPIDRPEQDDYRNGVWQIESDKSPREIKYEILRRIESKLGRQRSADKYAAREIDLDLILYGNEIIREQGLDIPDPDIRKRLFIAIPLAELDPELVLPDSGEKLRDLCRAMNREDMEVDAALTDALANMLKEEGAS
ncbi:MAG: 2-amino-4-hydroxy-6-hydroxymethyldihydropteridine diphosphokinase, partial [Candidatus Sumerlaeota bacterium]